jgi:hypothetical protein
MPTKEIKQPKHKEGVVKEESKSNIDPAKIILDPSTIDNAIPISVADEDDSDIE